MRVIPVLDLKQGVAVHAVRGERQSYVPVRSVLAPTADPVALASAFLAKLACRECYVADLDAIAARGDHGPTIRAIAATGLSVWLDAGVATAADTRRAVEHGAARVIVGTETLRRVEDLRAIATAPASAGRSVLSLDLRDGCLLGGAPDIEQLDPVELAELAWSAGVRTVIVLDLARVGSGGGVQVATALRLRAALPGAEIVVGGGVRDAGDLRDLARQGFDAALVATALHRGIITATTLTGL